MNTNIQTDLKTDFDKKENAEHLIQLDKYKNSIQYNKTYSFLTSTNNVLYFEIEKSIDFEIDSYTIRILDYDKSNQSFCMIRNFNSPYLDKIIKWFKNEYNYILDVEFDIKLKAYSRKELLKIVRKYKNKKYIHLSVHTRININDDQYFDDFNCIKISFSYLAEQLKTKVGLFSYLDNENRKYKTSFVKLNISNSSIFIG